MGDIQNEPKKESVKNIYGINEGLQIRINLYIIKYIYYHIDKAPCFIDEYGSGKKLKAYPVYLTEAFPLSRQRMGRINKGMPFEFTRREADCITKTYGIDIKYFRKDDPMSFDINGISDTDWKCFYNYKYECSYQLPPNISKDIIKKKNAILNALNKICVGWERELKKDDPIYAVCHYFHYAVRSDKPDIMTNLKEVLSVLDFREWDKADDETLKEVYRLMTGHYKYIHSILELKKLRNNPTGKNFKKGVL